MQLAGCNNAGAHSETHYHALKINFNPIRSGVESNIYRAAARVLSIEDARSRRSVRVVGAWLGWLHTLKRPGFNHNQQWRRRIFLSIYMHSRSVYLQSSLHAPSNQNMRCSPCSPRAQLNSL